MVNVRLMLGLGLVTLALVSGGFLLGDDKKPDDKDPKVTGALPPHYKSLGLSDDQVKKVKTIQATYKAKIDELEQKVKELKAEEKVEREKVLTDAQKARLKELLLGEEKDPKDKPVDRVPEKDKAPEKDKKPTDKPADK